MGYQEILRPIGHLAEAADIKEAIEAYRDNFWMPGYCSYYCGVRKKKPAGEHEDDATVPKKLYACFGGDRNEKPRSYGRTIP